MIGIFDSGLGGLSVMRAIRDVLPSADIVYFGDTKRAPYGEKSPAELAQLTVAGFTLLKAHGATRVVSACNSVSTSLALSLLDASGLSLADVVEMVGPTVRYLKDSDARILLVATTATVRSGIYQNAFHMMGKTITAHAIPELAGALERGGGTKEQVALITTALRDVDLTQFDMVIFGCTHFPFAHEAFRIVMPTMTFFDPAVAVADRVRRLFWPQEVGDGVSRFLVSRASDAFLARAQELFPDEQIHIEVVE